MITAAALLVLVALGLFVGGIAAGVTALYWACVAVSAVAAVLLVVAFVRMRSAAPATGAADGPAAAAPATAAVRTGVLATGATATGSGEAGHAPDYAPAEPGSAVASSNDDGLTDVPVQHASPTSSAATAPASHDGRTGDRSPAAQDDGPPAADGAEDPPVEEVEVTDLLLVVDLSDDVLVVDEHPRYHLAGCSWLAGRTTIALPVDEARTDGFTPCGRCAPDHHLAEVERGRRAAREAP